MAKRVCNFVVYGRNVCRETPIEAWSKRLENYPREVLNKKLAFNESCLQTQGIKKVELYDKGKEELWKKVMKMQ